MRNSFSNNNITNNGGNTIKIAVASITVATTLAATIAVAKATRATTSISDRVRNINQYDKISA